MTGLYVVIVLAVFVLQIIMVVKFFGIAKDIRLIARNEQNGSFYINRAEMEKYIGNTTAALENFKRAKFLYTSDPYAEVDYASQIAAIDKEIAELEGK